MGGNHIVGGCGETTLIEFIAKRCSKWFQRIFRVMILGDIPFSARQGLRQTTSSGSLLGPRMTPSIR